MKKSIIILISILCITMTIACNGKKDNRKEFIEVYDSDSNETSIENEEEYSYDEQPVEATDETVDIDTDEDDDLLSKGMYTIGGESKMLTTGETINLSEYETEVEIYKDCIIAGGLRYDFVKTEGFWRVYSGTNLGGGEDTYYVDSDYNIKLITSSTFMGRTDWFETPVSKN